MLGGEKGMPEAGSMLTFPQYAINLFEVVACILKLKFDTDLKDMFYGAMRMLQKHGGLGQTGLRALASSSVLG